MMLKLYNFLEFLEIVLKFAFKNLKKHKCQNL